MKRRIIIFLVSFLAIIGCGLLLTNYHENGVSNQKQSESIYDGSSVSKQRESVSNKSAKKKDDSEDRGGINISGHFMTNDASYKSGFSDGNIVGRADKRDGRKRRGIWAMENGKRLSQTISGNKKAYAAGYHRGYNEGWHAY